MADARVIRICLMLAGIFAAGVVTGRFTAPQPAPIVINQAQRPRGHTPASFTAEMTRRVGIDTNQQQQILPILWKMVREMQPHPPRTPARMEIFRRTMESIRPIIRTNQIAEFDRLIQDQTPGARRAQRQSGARSGNAE